MTNAINVVVDYAFVERVANHLIASAKVTALELEVNQIMKIILLLNPTLSSKEIARIRELAVQVYEDLFNQYIQAIIGVDNCLAAA